MGRISVCSEVETIYFVQTICSIGFYIFIYIQLFKFRFVIHTH